METPCVGTFKSQEEFDERTLSRAVSAHDTHLLKAREVVVEVVENDFLATRAVGGGDVERLAHIFGLEYLAPDVSALHFEARGPFLAPLARPLLEFVEGLLAVARLGAAGAGHSAHPVKLFAVKVVGAGNVGILCGDALSAFVEIVLVVAGVGIEVFAVEFKDRLAHVVEEVAVVRHHEQSLRGTLQIALEPFYHGEVEVVGRLVKHEQVGLSHQHVRQGHAFELSARKFVDGLRKIRDIEFRQDLLGAQLKVPCVAPLHFVEERGQARVALGGEALLVVADKLREFAGPLKTGVDDGCSGFEHGRLFKDGDGGVAAHDDAALFVVLSAGENLQQGAFACAVVGDETHFLSVGNRKTDVVEEFECAEAFAQMLYVE